MSEKIFAEGIYLNKVSETAPSFILTNQSIHIEKAIAWLQSMKPHADDKGYIKITGKEGKSGKRYFELDTWKPKEGDSPDTLPEYPREANNEDIQPQDIPF